MEVKKHCRFDIEASVARLDNYLNTAVDTEPVAAIPSRDEFTYDNGYYVDCCAIFIDIRHSSELTDEMSKKKAARIYRSFISEMTAIMQSYRNCEEINFAGDCVSGIFDARNENEIFAVFKCVAALNSQVELLNNRLIKWGYTEISAGIGVNYGRAFVVMSGYKGSELYDLVWTGDVVNDASHMCDMAGKNGYKCIVATSEFYQKLGALTCINADAKEVLCNSFLKRKEDIYHGDFWLVHVQNWIESH